MVVKRRRKWQVWETLVVLLANDGLCTYCFRNHAQEMDHVVALAVGGADTLDNLVPVCKPCNRSKGAKPLPEWLMGMCFSYRWHGDGTPQGPQGSLREMFEEACTDTWGALDLLGDVQAEIANMDRRKWIHDRAWKYRFAGLDLARRRLEPRMATAREDGWPPRHRIPERTTSVVS